MNTNDNKDNDRKKYSANQVKVIVYRIVAFVLVLIIAVLISIHDDPAFVSRFAFASTITSIILSVLAIFLSLVGEMKTQTLREKIEEETATITRLTEKMDNDLNLLGVQIKSLQHKTEEIQADLNMKAKHIPFSNGVRQAENKQEFWR
ncbi:MAG: hypothetical protein IJH64_14445 [Oscillospiraceae bacterium]|nr:hypothetical protein [Oscillospiraceae bacterium]